MTLWGQCPKCHHQLYESTFVRPQGIQRSENCLLCGWEEVVAVQIGRKGRWIQPDHTPQPDPPESQRIRGEGKRFERVQNV